MIKKRLSFLFLSVLSINLYPEEGKTVPERDTITVTGVRADTKTPVSQKTITKKDIDKTYQGEEIPVLLDKTPSITSQTDGGHPQGYTTFRLRGIDQTRMNMTLNGIPLNEPEDQGVYTSNYPGFANNIQSMQIQRGVGTSSNGVASYAGSINFESRNGLEKKTETQIGYGSWNTRRVNVTKSTGLSDKGYALFSNVSAYNSDGYKIHSGGKGYSLFLSGGLYEENNILKFTTFSGRSVNRMAWLAVPEEDIKRDRRTNANTKEENDEFMQSFIQLQHIRIFSIHSKLTTSLFHNRLDGNWTLDQNATGTGTEIINYKLGSNFSGLISNYSYTYDSLNLNFGVSANTYDRKHSIAPNAVEGYYSNVGKKSEYSSFFKVGYDFGKLTVFGDAQYRVTGFRYEGDVKLDPQKWKFFNPKAGIVYTYDTHLNFYFSVGQSHREPTRTNLFGGKDNLKEFIPIKPEEVVDYELGLNFKMDKLSVQSNLYYMNFKNEITLLGALGANGLPLMTNVNKSYRSGAELDFSYRVLQWLRIFNNTNASHNRIIDSGKEFQPLYTPQLVVNQGIEFIQKGFILSLHAKHHSKSYINFENTKTTPAFVIYGFNLSYEFFPITFLLQCNNLTNVNYYTSGYAVENISYYFANAPMSIYATLKVDLE